MQLCFWTVVPSSNLFFGVKTFMHVRKTLINLSDNLTLISELARINSPHLPYDLNFH